MFKKINRPKSAVSDKFSTPARRRRLIAEFSKQCVREYYKTAIQREARRRLENSAALAIQCALRCCFAKMKVKYVRYMKRRRAAVTLQQIWRIKRARMRVARLRAELLLRNQIRLAIHCQNLYRLRKDRLHRLAIDMMRRQRLLRERNSAAVEIQRLFRGYLGRKVYALRLAERETERQRRHKASILIQCCVRKRLAYKRVVLERQYAWAVGVVRQRVLNWYWRKKAKMQLNILKRRMAAKRMQSYIRRWLARVERKRRARLVYGSIESLFLLECILEIACESIGSTPGKKMSIHVEVSKALLCNMAVSGPEFVVNWSLSSSIIHFSLHKGYSLGAIAHQVVTSVDNALGSSHTEASPPLSALLPPSSSTFSDKATRVTPMKTSTGLPPSSVFGGNIVTSDAPILDGIDKNSYLSPYKQKQQDGSGSGVGDGDFGDVVVTVDKWNEGEDHDKPCATHLPHDWAEFCGHIQDTEFVQCTSTLSALPVLSKLIKRPKPVKSTSLSIRQADGGRVSISATTRVAAYVHDSTIELHIQQFHASNASLSFPAFMVKTGADTAAISRKQQSVQPSVTPVSGLVPSLLVIVFTESLASQPQPLVIQESPSKPMYTLRDLSSKPSLLKINHQQQQQQQPSHEIDDVKFRFKNAVVFVALPPAPVEVLSSPVPCVAVSKREEYDIVEDNDGEEDDDEDSIHLPEAATAAAPSNRPQTAVVRLILHEPPRIPSPPPAPVDCDGMARRIQKVALLRLERRKYLVRIIQNAYIRSCLIFRWQSLVYKQLEVMHQACIVIQCAMRCGLSRWRRKVLKLKYDRAHYYYGHDFDKSEEEENWKAFGMGALSKWQPQPQQQYCVSALAVDIDATVSQYAPPPKTGMAASSIKSSSLGFGDRNGITAGRSSKAGKAAKGGASAAASGASPPLLPPPPPRLSWLSSPTADMLSLIEVPGAPPGCIVAARDCLLVAVECLPLSPPPPPASPTAAAAAAAMNGKSVFNEKIKHPESPHCAPSGADILREYLAETGGGNSYDDNGNGNGKVIAASGDIDIDDNLSAVDSLLLMSDMEALGTKNSFSSLGGPQVASSPLQKNAPYETFRVNGPLFVDARGDDVKRIAIPSVAQTVVNSSLDFLSVPQTKKGSNFSSSSRPSNSKVNSISATVAVTAVAAAAVGRACEFEGDEICFGDVNPVTNTMEEITSQLMFCLKRGSLFREREQGAVGHSLTMTGSSQHSPLRSSMVRRRQSGGDEPIARNSRDKSSNARSAEISGDNDNNSLLLSNNAAIEAMLGTPSVYLSLAEKCAW